MLNDKEHPAHGNMELGLELVHLLRWILEDELCLVGGTHLLPQVNLCEHCHLDPVQMNQVLGSSNLEDPDHLFVLQMTLFQQVEPEGTMEEVATYKL